MLEELRREHLPLLLVDGGNLLFKSTGGQSILDQDRLAADTIVDIYQDLGYSAVAVGPHDLAAGPGLLAAAAAKGFPWVSANLVDEHGNLLFPPWVLVEIGGKTVGILGLTGQTSGPGYSTRVWRDALPQYLDQLFPSCDFLMVLSSLTMEENTAIAGMFPQIHLLVSAEKSGGNMVPALHTNTLIVQTHSQGKYVGILDIEWGEGVIWADAAHNAPAVAAMLEQRENGLKKRQALRYSGVARLEGFFRFAAGKSGSTEGWQGGRYAFRFRSLAPHIQPSQPVEHTVAKMKAHIAEVNRQYSHNQAGAAAALPDKGASVDFAGPATCQSCHPYQFEQWQQSSHSTAYATLHGAAQQYNLRCLPCHTTWEMASGTAAEGDATTVTLELLRLPEYLQNVGCESCHGPGLNHIKDGAADSLAEVNERTCLPCHSQQMDPDFRFQEKVGRLQCVQPR